jgi:3'(2'), 5'-bisphosphate nucleotidase
MLDALVEIAREAGRAILEVYDSEFDVSYKEDSSPLTVADRRSHEIISARLGALDPVYPVLSEEGRDIPYEERMGWERFWLVDPLDGTKEFVKRNGEFTVNIALIEGTSPVAGVLHVPVKGLTYFARKGGGAFLKEGEGQPIRITTSEIPPDGYRVAASRSHGSEELDRLLSRLDVKERVSRGSALKFALVAGGEADFYPRLGPTWEWDTGAGHCIVDEAGGAVLDWEGNPLLYNKKILKHEGFLAISRREMFDKIK